MLFVDYLATPNLMQGAGHGTPPRVVGRAWRGPPPGVVGDPLPLHSNWEEKKTLCSILSPVVNLVTWKKTQT